MFFVINKNKIYTYIVTVCMIVILFALSFAAINNNESVVTSTNSEEIVDVNNNL